MTSSVRAQPPHRTTVPRSRDGPHRRPVLHLAATRSRTIVLTALTLLASALLPPGLAAQTPPLPLKRNFDEALVDQALQKRLPEGPPSRWCATAERERTLTVSRPGSCPSKWRLNNKSKFLYGDTYVIHIYVDRPGKSWQDSSLNPFTDTRDSEAASVRNASEWIEDQAPSGLSVDFNTSHTTTYSYYNSSWDGGVTIDDDDTWLLVDVPEDIGFWDSDGDGEVLDDMLEYLRTLDGGGWEHVVAVFHVKEPGGRSYASLIRSWTVCFNGIVSAVYAHEMTHLYGAADEYEEGGTCHSGYDCTRDFENDWIEPTYKNGNCEIDACGEGHGSCMMRGPPHQFLFWLDYCSYTKGHIGWRDDDSDGVRDLQESAPWVFVTTALPDRTASSVVTLNGTAETAYGWTHIDQIQYRVDGGVWQNATVNDGTLDEYAEPFTVNASISGDGNHTIEVRSRTAMGQLQTCTWDDDVTLDQTGPHAPVVWCSSHSSQSTWYPKTTVDLSWWRPSDGAGVAGYSIDLDQNPGTVPNTTIDQTGLAKSYAGVADGVWYFHVRAQDGLGNWGPTAHRTIRVDTTAPTAPVITCTTHDPDDYSNAATASFSWSSTDAHSGVSGYTRAGLDQDPTADAATSGASSTTSKNFTVPSVDGDWYFHVRATDDAGNWTATQHRRIRVDRTPPKLTVSSSTHPDSMLWYPSGSGVVSWTPTAPDLAGIEGYSYAKTFDDPNVSPDEVLDTSGLTHSYSGMASGWHWFGVHGVDYAGNWSTIARVVMKVDVTQPDTVTNLASPSHWNAIGQLDCEQSSDRTIEVTWSAAADAHSGMAGYSIAWNHDPDVGPDTGKDLPASATGTTSGSLADGDDWYFHVRAVDAVGNWDSDYATLGPFVIQATEPSRPWGLQASVGSAVDTVTWRPPAGGGDFTYKVHRPLYGQAFGAPIATGLVDTFFIDAWPGIQNGDTYFYAVSAVDSCNNESGLSELVQAAPEFVSPGNGHRWDMEELADSSYGAFRTISAATYEMYGNVTISQTDTVDIGAGNTILSTDRTGQKKLTVHGAFYGHGTPSSVVTVGSATGTAGSWGGIEVSATGDLSASRHVRVRAATIGIRWESGNPSLTSVTVEGCSGTGILASAVAAGTCTIDSCVVRNCGGTGIDVFGASNSFTQVSACTLTKNFVGIHYDVNPANPPPQLLTIADNFVYRQLDDGISCGRGAINCSVVDNVVRENLNGIVFDGEVWMPMAQPLVQGNLVSGNLNAGIYTSQQSSPLCQSNIIVSNGNYGCYSRHDANPTYTGNTITGSKYGIYVELSPWQVPDFGNPPTTPGMNRLDGHSILWARNNGGVAMNAIFNFWGTAQANPAVVIGGASAVNWAPVWNIVNQPPTISLQTPNGETRSDSLTIAWTDNDPDPFDDATINLFYDDDASGLDGTQIEGASDISEDDPANTYLWDTRPVPAGTYYVYAVISDDYESASSYSPGTVTIEQPSIRVRPDSLLFLLEPGGIWNDTVWVANDGTTGLNGSFAADSTWVAFPDGPGFSVADDESVFVRVRVDAGSLTDGSYAANIDITSDDHADSVRSVSVRVEVGKPDIVVSPSALAFGDVQVDSSADLELLVMNFGTLALRIDTVRTTEPFDGWGTAFPDTVWPGDTLTIDVGFAPTLPGSFADSLSILSNDSDVDTLFVPMSGLGLGPWLSSPDTVHDFGEVALGDTGSWSFPLINTGTTSLSVLSGAFDSTGFALIEPPLAASIAAGETLEVAVAFHPFEARAYSTDLVLHTDAVDWDSVSIHLNGTGIMPAATLLGGPVTLDTVRPGSGSSADLYVVNTGTDTLDLVDATTTSPFTVELVELRCTPQDTVHALIEYRPTEIGTDSAQVFIATDSPTTPSLSTWVHGACAAPAAEVAPSALDFGRVHADSQQATQLWLHNHGGWPLTLSWVGARFGVYYEVVGPIVPHELAADDSVAVGVTFLGGPIGTHLDTVLILSDDDAAPTLAVPLTAQAVSPEIVITVMSGATQPAQEIDITSAGYDFGPVSIAEGETRALRIRNAGTDTLTLTGVAVATSIFELGTLGLPAKVAPDTFRALSVSFAPTSTATFRDTLVLTSDDRETPEIALPLSGRGSDAVAVVAPGSIEQTVFEGDTTWIGLEFVNEGEAAYQFRVRRGDEVPGSMPAGKAPSAARPPRAGKDWGGAQPVALEPAWISLSDTAGWVTSLDTTTVAVGLIADAAGRGFHYASLIVLTSDADLDTVTIPVAMAVPRMRHADHDVGAFRATVTDGGAFGFWDIEELAAFGSGFVYPKLGGANRLFHGSLWVGAPPDQVSDASYDYDFRTIAGGALTLTGADPQYSRARFDDSLAPQPLEIEVDQEALVYPAPSYDDFLMLRYTIRNQAALAIDSLFVGLWMDWDIGDLAANAGRYEAPRALAYMYNPSLADSVYAGIVMLHPSTPDALHFVDHPTLPEYGVPVDSLKYALLSEVGVDVATAGLSDWSMVMGVGPFDLAPGESQRVAFAMVAGIGLEAVRMNAEAARALLTDVAPGVPTRFQVYAVRPNPSQATATVVFDLPRRAPVRAAIFDLQGRVVERFADRILNAGRHHLEWSGQDRTGRTVPAGIYFWRLEAAGSIATRKLVRLE